MVTSVNYAYFAAFAFPFQFKSLGDFFTNFNERPKDNLMILLWVFIEIIFVIDIVLIFLKEYRSDINFQVVRDPRLIARRYLRSSFFFDLIAVIPANLLIFAFRGGEAASDGKNFAMDQIIYMLKILRVRKASEIMSAKFMNGIVESWYKRRRDRLIKNAQLDPSFYLDPLIDHNQILTQIKFKSAFKIFRLGTLILIFSYFCSIFIYIFFRIELAA